MKRKFRIFLHKLKLLVQESFVIRSIRNYGVKSIVSCLSDLERRFIGDDDKGWQRPDILLYRHVKWGFLNPIAFVDVYRFSAEPGVGYICIAVKPKYRQRSIAKKLVIYAIKFIQYDSRIDRVGWLVDSDNLPSIQFAESLGFTKYKDIDGEIIYQNDFESFQFITKLL